jgi:uncharacterized protein YndB with AHSA1/START domain
MTTKSSSDEPVIVERLLNAPIELVWKAITTKEDMKRWYFDLPEFKAEAGFEFEFTGGPKDGVQFLHKCKVTEVIPLRKLAYSWRYEGYEGNSVVTIELAAEGSRTRIKLSHEGLETFPPTPEFARENFVSGWTAIVGSSLREFVEKTADREIVIERVMDAPRELVWKAWTDPNQVVNWWGPNGFTTTVHSMDVQPGGVWAFTMHGPDGADYPNKSVFIEVAKPERIIYSHGGGRKGAPGANFEAAWTFESEGANRTNVTNRMVFSSPEERDVVARTYGAVEGGNQTLARLSEYLFARNPAAAGE